MLQIDRWPELRNPAMVYGFAGWVDAGLAGAGVIAELIAQASAAQRFASFDLSDVLDLQQTRPTVSIDEGQVRRVDWPRFDFWAGNAGRDFVLAVGPEPSIRWPSLAGEIVGVARHVGVEESFAVGGMPVLASHRRPVKVAATATTRSLAQELGALRADYAGPTGFNTVVQHALGEAGVRSASLWAEVPQYVSGSPSPPAVSALLVRLNELAGFSLDVSKLDARTSEYRAKVDEGLAEHPDVERLVAQLEERLDEELPSGTDLVGEIEKFLRDQR